MSIYTLLFIPLTGVTVGAVIAVTAMIREALRTREWFNIAFAFFFPSLVVTALSVFWFVMLRGHGIV